MPGICEAFQAIINEDVAELQKLIKLKNLNLSLTFRGSTALSLAVCHNHLQSVCILLKAGAPINQKSKDQLDRVETPLISAIRLGLEDIALELINNGAKLDVQDFYHQTPLTIAVSELRTSIVKLLLKKNAPIYFIKSLESPLNHIIQFINYKAQREVALELIAAGLPINLKDAFGRRPLHWTAHHADFTFFSLLIEAGSPFNINHNETDLKIPRTWLEDPNIVLWVDREGRNPPPLNRQCRNSIRNYIRRMHNKDLRPLLQRIPLPPILLDYLLLKNALEIAGYKDSNE